MRCEIYYSHLINIHPYHMHHPQSSQLISTIYYFASIQSISNDSSDRTTILSNTMINFQAINIQNVDFFIKNIVERNVGYILINAGLHGRRFKNPVLIHNLKYNYPSCILRDIMGI